MGKSAGLLGTVAFGAIGGLVGGLFTAGTFSSVGVSVGMMIGGMLFAQPQAPGASSVNDLKANVAEPAFLPIVCGDDVPDPAHPGQLLPGGVWLPGKIVKVPQKGGVSTKKRKSKKKGGTAGRLYGAPAQGEKDRFLSCAYAWCEGSLEHPCKLRELRFDDKLFFRDDAKPNETGYIARSFVYDALGNEVGWTSDTIHHYYGTQTQGADDVMSTWYDGDGAPALRGTCYTVVIALPINDFGHVPQAYARISNGISSRREQCRFYLNRANGLDGLGALQPSRIQLGKIGGHQRGWFMTQPGSPRSIAELIASRAFCALVEHSYGIHDVDLANPTIHDLEDWELSARAQTGSDGESKAVPRFKRGRGAGPTLASKVEVRYADGRKRDENTVNAILPTATSENVQTFDMPCVDVEEEITAWAQVTLDASHVARATGDVAVLPRRLDVFPGDVIRVPRTALSDDAPVGSLLARDRVTLMVQNRVLGLPGPLDLSGAGWSADVYRNVPRIIPPPDPAEAVSYAAPLLFVAQTVALEDEALKEGGILIAASQKAGFKWGKGAYVEVDELRGTWKETDGYALPERATMGQTLTDWTVPSPFDGYTSGNPLDVEMFWGRLYTAPEGGVRGGANVLLLENGLVVSFATALQTGLASWGEGQYELGGIKAGRWGSDAILPPGASVPVGTRFVLLTDENGEREDAVYFDGIPAKRLTHAMRARGWMFEKRNLESKTEWIYSGLNMKPLAPTGVRARWEGEGLRLTGRSRTRDARDDGWNTVNGHATEPRKAAGFRFRVTLQLGAASRTVERYTLDDGGSFDWTWTAGELAALFGAQPTALSGTVTMIGDWGEGFAAFWEATQ